MTTDDCCAIRPYEEHGGPWGREKEAMPKPEPMDAREKAIAVLTHQYVEVGPFGHRREETLSLHGVELILDMLDQAGLAITWKGIGGRG